MTPEPERQDFRCRTCGYGICVERLPSFCPLCKGQSWVLVPMPEISAMLLGIVQDEQATGLARI